MYKYATFFLPDGREIDVFRDKEGTRFQGEDVTNTNYVHHFAYEPSYKDVCIVFDCV